jgi:hypothetical protein
MTLQWAPLNKKTLTLARVYVRCVLCVTRRLSFLRFESVQLSFATFWHCPKR